ncbi:MAG: nucleotidyltransferase domain-containing protein [Chitinophagales bacterium]
MRISWPAGLSPAWREGLEAFCQAVQDRLAPDCVILAGSVADGTYCEASDLDLVVIASDLPSDFFRRLALLAELRSAGVPLEAIGYTPEEFRRMLREGHVTALEAYHKGLPLLGEDWFETERRSFLALMGRGLRRVKGAWILPEEAEYTSPENSDSEN